MVLSLPFILALVGAGVGLLVGILIFGEVSDAIECPAGTSGGGSPGADLFNILGLADAVSSFESEDEVEFIGQLVTLSNQQIYSIRIEDWDWTLPDVGYLTAKIWSNVTLDEGWAVEEASSETITFGTGSQYRVADFDHTFIFTTNPILSGSDIVIGFEKYVFDPVNCDNINTPNGECVPFPSILFTVGGNVGTYIEGEPEDVWDLPQGCCINGMGDNPVPMQVVLFEGSEGSPALGSEQCESAKDTAWTVIGIMPVALFFGLFALFSSFQRPT